MRAYSLRIVTESDAPRQQLRPVDRRADSGGGRAAQISRPGQYRKVRKRRACSSADLARRGATRLRSSRASASSARNLARRIRRSRSGSAGSAGSGRDRLSGDGGAAGGSAWGGSDARDVRAPLAEFSAEDPRPDTERLVTAASP